MIVLSAASLVLRLCKWACALLTALAAGSVYMMFSSGIDFTAVIEVDKQLQSTLGLSLPFKAVEVLIAIFEATPMFLLFGLTMLFRWGERRATQWNDDLSVRSLVELLRRGIRRPFVLYLRSFDTTNVILTRNPTPQLPLPMIPSEALRDPNFELEQTIKVAIGRYWKLVALGRPGEHVGAARVQTTEEEWKGAVAELARAAKLIVCVPAANAGTRWEVNHLRETYQLEKTVFLMPPASQRFDVPSAWKEAVHVLANDGIELPSYDDEGAAFQIERTGRLSQSFGVNFASPKTVRVALKAVARAVDT